MTTKTSDLSRTSYSARLKKEANQLALDYCNATSSEDYEAASLKLNGLWKQCSTSGEALTEVLLAEMAMAYNQLAYLAQLHHCNEHPRQTETLALSELHSQRMTESEYLINSLQRVRHFCNMREEKLSEEQHFTMLLDSQLGDWRELKVMVCMVACLWVLVSLRTRGGPDSLLLAAILRTVNSDIINKVTMIGGFVFLGTKEELKAKYHLMHSVESHLVFNIAYYLAAVNSFKKQDLAECEGHLSEMIDGDNLYGPLAQLLKAKSKMVLTNYDEADDALDEIYGNGDDEHYLPIFAEKEKLLCKLFECREKKERAVNRAILLYKKYGEKPSQSQIDILTFVIQLLQRNYTGPKIQLPKNSVKRVKSELIQQRSQERCNPNKWEEVIDRHQIETNFVSGGGKLEIWDMVQRMWKKLSEVNLKQTTQKPRILPSTWANLLKAAVVEHSTQASDRRSQQEGQKRRAASHDLLDSDSPKKRK